jgi:hypothetical protein
LEDRVVFTELLVIVGDPLPRSALLTEFIESGWLWPSNAASNPVPAAEEP